MVERKKIALVYSYNENWIGGTYYIQNLIQALNLLDDIERPQITILSNKANFLSLKEVINYPYLSWVESFRRPKFLERICNRVSRAVISKNIFETRLKGDLFDMVYPVGMDYSFRLLSNKVSWIPDFQEDYLPHFFSEEEIKGRKNDQSQIANAYKKIVFSSNNAKNDFERLYPTSKAKLYVVPFAVTHVPNVLSPEEVKEKYELHMPHYICSNQFWTHKNHFVVLEALKILKDKGVENTCVVFTGKPYDYRSPEYYDEILSYISENKLEKQARVLGFIPREDQLSLLESSLAVIQPSFFEGWGTTVEDAKSNNKHVIASDIPVHREQLSINFSLFSPNDSNELAKLLSIKTPEIERFDYSINVKKFAQDFIDILKDN